MNYETNLFSGDCLEIMPKLEEKSFDLILSDPPYQITQCAWDKMIPFAPMWENIKRILKPGGTVALFGSQPFTSKLVMSNLKWFRYCWVWEKDQGVGGLNSKKMPLKSHEDISVFYEKLSKYNPQFLDTKETWYKKDTGGNYKEHLGKKEKEFEKKSLGTLRYPKTVLKFSNQKTNRKHPTQKPAALMEYLIKTYTDQGDHILDFCMGSGSTGVACQNTGRHFTGIELESKYFKIAQQRMKENRRLLVF